MTMFEFLTFGSPALGILFLAGFLGVGWETLHWAHRRGIEASGVAGVAGAVLFGVVWGLVIGAIRLITFVLEG